MENSSETSTYQEISGVDENRNTSINNISSQNGSIQTNPCLTKAETREYLCKKCDYKALSRQKLKTHYYKHKQKIFVCDRCPDNCRKCEREKTKCSFKTAHDLRSHIVYVHTSESEINWYHCKDCQMKFKSANHLLRHTNRIHRKLKALCPYCGSNFSASSLNHHIKVQHKHFRYCCETCSSVFRSIEALRYHENSRHPKDVNPTLLKCSYCAFTTFMKQRLTAHEFMQHRKPLHTCSLCPYQTKSQNALKMHIYSKHQEARDMQKVKMYKCKNCDYATHRIYNFKVHELKHTKSEDLPSFECFHCGFTAKRKDNLKAHIYRHDYYRPVHKCAICKFKTKSKTDYKKHIGTHSDEEQKILRDIADKKRDNEKPNNMKQDDGEKPKRELIVLLERLVKVENGNRLSKTVIKYVDTLCSEIEVLEMQSMVEFKIKKL